MPYPETTFAVLSDPHVYAPELGIEGAAFQAFLRQSPNMPKESLALLDRAVDDIIKSPAQFLLIPGDLTNYGERASHRRAAQALSRLPRAGKPVFVIPGNHDIRDGLARAYRGAETLRAPGIAPRDFPRLYRRLGYEAALLRDKTSLSYVAEPAPGLWLLALDSNRYGDNRPGREPVVDGRIPGPTQAWADRVLEAARKNGKAVMVMCHHGVVEHWKGQHRLRWEYLLKDYRKLGARWARQGVRLAFTGHDHASDIACLPTAHGPLYDVSTGSLASTGHTWRLCHLAARSLRVETVQLRDTFRPGSDFAKRSRQAIESTVFRVAYETCRRYYLPEPDARYLAQTLAVLLRAHNEGDEDAASLPRVDVGRLSPLGRLAYLTQRYVYENLPQNPGPADNAALLAW